MRKRSALWCGLAGIALLAGCNEPLDFDLRGKIGGFSTADAARGATADRPTPDDRGVISYPNYQVAVARNGDTVSTVAARVGLGASELAKYNGIAADAPLRAGEVIALPRRVAEPSPATGSATTGPIQPGNVDIAGLAGDAIDSAPDTTPIQTTTLKSTKKKSKVSGEEPVRHKVERGETAYIIARLYNVSPKALAEWNGLGPDFAIREGQYLLIPVASAKAPPKPGNVSQPGSGSSTPTPPSATAPLPDKDVTANVPPPAPVSVGEPTRSSKAEMDFPVQGKIIRTYSKGKNEGIDIAAAPGTPVKAATGGTVAAVTANADTQVPIVVLRHPSNLLTVYANIEKIKVAKGDKVKRGQALGEIPGGNAAYVHFEVRDGFDSVNPLNYLE